MKPRRERWLSIPEVLTNLRLKYPELYLARLDGKTRQRQLEVVRRLVRRAERRDAERYTKRVDGDIFVNLDTLEALLPVDVEKVAAVERKLENLHESHRGLCRQVNGHGSRLRNYDKRLTIVEEVQQYIADSQASIAKATALLSRG